MNLKKVLKNSPWLKWLILAIVIVVNDNDYQYQFSTSCTTKKCIWPHFIYVYAKLYKFFMTDGKTSILLSDVSIEGEVVEKDKIIIDAKVTGDIKAEDIITHSKSNIVGNLKSKFASLGGKLKGNVSSDRINIKKTANIEGVLTQKNLSVQEGAQLKIKAETYK